MGFVCGYRPTILWFTCSIPSITKAISARRACHLGYKGSESQGVQIASSFRCKSLVFVFLHGFRRAPVYQLQFLQGVSWLDGCPRFLICLLDVD